MEVKLKIGSSFTYMHELPYYKHSFTQRIVIKRDRDVRWFEDDIKKNPDRYSNIQP